MNTTDNGEKVVLFVKIKKTLLEAIAKKKKGQEDDYRKTIRDMTVQYWPISEELGKKVCRVCGIYENKIISSFPVLPLEEDKRMYKLECLKYEKYIDEADGKVKFRQTDIPRIRYGFRCGLEEKEYVGIQFPEGEKWVRHYWVYKTISESDFINDFASRKDDTETLKNRNVLHDIVKDIDYDSDDHKSHKYDADKHYGQTSWGYYRDPRIRNKSLMRAENLCEIYGLNICDTCRNCTSSDENLEVHHINEMHEGSTVNDNVGNEIVLCRKHHREYHYKYSYEDKIKEKQIFADIRQNKP